MGLGEKEHMKGQTSIASLSLSFWGRLKRTCQNEASLHASANHPRQRSSLFKYRFLSPLFSGLSILFDPVAWSVNNAFQSPYMILRLDVTTGCHKTEMDRLFTPFPQYIAVNRLKSNAFILFLSLLFRTLFTPYTSLRRGLIRLFNSSWIAHIVFGTG